MMSPLWHDKVLVELKKQDNEQATQIYENLFEHLPRPSKTVKQKLKKTAMTIKNRQADRSLKPVEYKRVHIEKYNSEIKDPTIKHIFFQTRSKQQRDQLATSHNNYETLLLQSDVASPKLTMASNDGLQTVKRLKPEKIASNSQIFKSAEDFALELKKQLDEKESVVGQTLIVEVLTATRA